MSESFNAEFSIEFKDQAEANAFIDALHLVGDSAEMAESQIDSLDRATNRAIQNARGNTQAIKAQEAAYRSYAQSIQVANQAQRDAAQRQNAAFSSYGGNIDASNAQVQYAQQANSAVAGENQSARAKELAALRADITARNSLYQQSARAQIQFAQEANREKLQYAQQGNADILRNEQQTRAAELGSLRAQITERNKVYQESSRAQIAYANEVNKTGAAYGSAIASSDDLNNRLGATRYALYDVARSWTVVSAATLGYAAVTTAIAATAERDFASVARTTGALGVQLGELRNSLLQLSTDIPRSFGDISGIATIGAQLDVANADLDEFTKTVAMFSATTDTTVDRAAVGIGRLAQLTGTAGADYERLASSIYQTGVTAVATESEILAVSEQIATAGDLAGFANYEIIALASSLASLGVQPEAARGSIMRIFDEIEKAAANGGESLDQFASLSNMSAQGFAEAWNSDPQVAFTAFINGLSGAAAAGENTNAMLQDLGIRAVRDIRALQVLANNTEVYAQALDESAVAYEQGTSLGEGFAVQTDNVLDSLTELVNTLKAIATAGGEGMLSVLKPFINVLQGVADIAFQVSQTELGQFFIGASVAVAAGLGLFAAYRASLALAQASVAGLQLAQEGLRANTNLLGTGFAGLAREMLQMVGISGALTNSQRAYTASMAAGNGVIASRRAQVAALTTQLRGQAAAEQGTAAATNATATATRGATTAALGFGTALKATGVGLLVTGGLFALQSIIDAIGSAFESSEEKAKNFFGDMTTLTDAIKADTQVYKETGESIRTIISETTTSNPVLDEWAVSLGAAADAQVKLSGNTSSATDEISRQTLAIGENSRTALAEMLVNNEQFQNSWKANGEAVKVAGFDLQSFFDASLSGDGGGTAYLDELIAKNEEIYYSYADLATSGQAYTDAQTRQAQQAQVNIAALQSLRDAASAVDGSFASSIDSIQFNSEVMQAAGITAEETAEDISQVSDSVLSLGDSANALAGVQSALEGLGESLSGNSDGFSAYSQAGRDSLDALSSTLSAFETQAAGDTQAFGANVVGLMAALQQGGVATTDELNYVGDVLNSLVGSQYGIDFNSAAARQDIQAFIQQAIAALEVRAQLERTAMSSATGADRSKAAQQYAGTVDSIIALQGFAAQSTNALNNAQKGLARGYKGAGDAAKKSGKDTKNAAKEFRTLSDYVSDLQKVLQDAFTFRFGQENALDDIQEKWDSLAESIVADTASINDAFDKTFGVGQRRDSIRQTFFDMQEAAQDAADKIVDAGNKILDIRAKLSELQANEKVLNYQLGVATLYDDVLRAEQIRAELQQNASDSAGASTDLANSQRDLAEATAATNKTLTGTSQAAVQNRSSILKLLKEYTDYIDSVAESGASQSDLAKVVNQSRADFTAQARALGYNASELGTYSGLLNSSYLAQGKNSTALTGNSEAARNNRAALQGLAQSYQEYILELIRSGASQEEVNAAVARSQAEFTRQATALGFSEVEVRKYAASFSDLTTIINRMPKNVTVAVSARTDPAVRALNEFIARANSSTANVGLTASGGGVYNASGINVGSGGVRTPDLTADRVFTKNGRAGGSGLVQLAVSTGGEVPRYLAGGGATGRTYGPKGTDTIPAWLTPGEFVQNKQAVDHYGLPFMNALNNMQVPVSQPNISRARSAGSSGVAVVELSPTDRALLAAAGNVTLTLDGQIVAKATNASNTGSAYRGRA